MGAWEFPFQYLWLQSWRGPRRGSHNLLSDSHRKGRGGKYGAGSHVAAMSSPIRDEASMNLRHQRAAQNIERWPINITQHSQRQKWLLTETFS
jgi:hypothetical protein